MYKDPDYHAFRYMAKQLEREVAPPDDEHARLAARDAAQAVLHQAYSEGRHGDEASFSSAKNQ